LEGEGTVSVVNYTADQTGLLFVDPYNDFLSKGGKLWPAVEAVATEVRLLEHLRIITDAVRIARIPIFIVPHHRSEPGDFADWNHPTPYQRGSPTNRYLRRAHGAANGIPRLLRSMETRSSKSTGDQAVSLAPTSTSC
jgi:nicotinamidase-related amidase